MFTSLLLLMLSILSYYLHITLQYLVQVRKWLCIDFILFLSSWPFFVSKLHSTHMMDVKCSVYPQSSDSIEMDGHIARIQELLIVFTNVPVVKLYCLLLACTYYLVTSTEL